jgi:glycosyltransferase involved in cell wall biosynthesis
MLGPTKLNHRLLNAWLASSLAQDPQCHLIFVGKNDQGSYGQDLLAKIQQANLEDRIHITGFMNPEQYRYYLGAADIAVQLRTLSRGETSRSVLEVMAYGLPLIVNAHGPVNEYSDDVLIKLPDNFIDAELVTQLEKLQKNSQLRHNFSRSEVNYIANNHSPKEIVHQYQSAIESIGVNSFYNLYRRTLKAIGSIDTPVDLSEEDLSMAAKAIAANTPVIRQRQLLVDISELVQRDVRSGIQRVVRSVLSHCLLNSPSGWRIEPVYATMERDGYRYARRFTSRFLGLPEDWAVDDLVELYAGDVFFGLDLQPHIVLRQIEVLKDWYRRGVCVQFLVYDLLPILRPEFFPDGAKDGFQPWLEAVAQFDGAVCISRAVADELQSWLHAFGPNRARPFAVQWFHLGADTKNSAPSTGMPVEAPQVLAALQARPSFLSVGTIEPRKGHVQALSAFEALWERGIDANLVFVGKQGWMVEVLVDRLRNHTERGKRLFWLEGISDEYLEQVYAASTCLMVASEAEGFGLPLIEAAQHQLPIIARDIPVFREVAGNHAFYFQGTEPEDLANAITTWLKLYAEGQAPGSTGMQWLTWEESTLKLMETILKR